MLVSPNYWKFTDVNFNGSFGHRRLSIRLWSTLMTQASFLAEIAWLFWLWYNRYYSRFSRDATAVMFVYRTVVKKSILGIWFRLLLCQTRATFYHYLVHQYVRLITWVKTKNLSEEASHNVTRFTHKYIGGTLWQNPWNWNLNARVSAQRKTGDFFFKETVEKGAWWFSC